MMEMVDWDEPCGVGRREEQERDFAPVGVTCESVASE